MPFKTLYIIFFRQTIRIRGSGKYFSALLEKGGPGKYGAALLTGKGFHIILESNDFFF